MGKSADAGPQFWWFDPPELVVFLKERYPNHTAKRVAQETGAPVRTVENWLAGNSAPNVFWAFRMVGLYGPEFLARVMTNPPDWLSAARMAQKRAEITKDLDDLQRQLEALDPV